MPFLEKFDGPACPRCGCQDSTIAQEPRVIDERWPVPGVAKCNHCGWKFGFQEDGEKESERPVYAPKARCPECGMCETEVYKSMPANGSSRVRYHKCLREGCEKTFKTSSAAEETDRNRLKMSA